MPPKEEAAAAGKVTTKTKEERIATVSGSLLGTIQNLC